MEKKKRRKRKKGKGQSVQDLIGIKTFTKYGLQVGRYELLFYQIAPTNISVLSKVNVEVKIRHLMMVLSTIPDLEAACTDSCESFDDNKVYLRRRLEEEGNPRIRNLLRKDLEFLDSIQAEMASNRQFVIIGRCKNLKPEQVFNLANRIEKVVSEQGIEIHRMRKPEIKRFLAVYFDASPGGRSDAGRGRSAVF